MSKVVLMPTVSEKAMSGTQQGVYVFSVPIIATKIEIKRAVEEEFKVKVLTVNTATTKGKSVSFRRQKGKRSDYKKAMVKLIPGNKIALFEEKK